MYQGNLNRMNESSAEASVESKRVFSSADIATLAQKYDLPPQRAVQQPLNLDDVKKAALARGLDISGFGVGNLDTRSDIEKQIAAMPKNLEGVTMKAFNPEPRSTENDARVFNAADLKDAIEQSSKSKKPSIFKRLFGRK